GAAARRSGRLRRAPGGPHADPRRAGRARGVQPAATRRCDCRRGAQLAWLGPRPTRRGSAMPRRRFAALAAIAALTLAACGNTDASRGDVVNAMRDAGLSQEQANCIGDGFEDEFSQSQLNEIASADEPAGLPKEPRGPVTSIIQRCVEGQGDGGGGGTTTTDGTTTTTEG